MNAQIAVKYLAETVFRNQSIFRKIGFLFRFCILFYRGKQDNIYPIIEVGELGTTASTKVFWRGRVVKIFLNSRGIQVQGLVADIYETIDNPRRVPYFLVKVANDMQCHVDAESPLGIAFSNAQVPEGDRI